MCMTCLVFPLEHFTGQIARSIITACVLDSVATAPVDNFGFKLAAMVGNHVLRFTILDTVLMCCCVGQTTRTSCNV